MDDYRLDRLEVFIHEQKMKILAPRRWCRRCREESASSSPNFELCRILGLCALGFETRRIFGLHVSSSLNFETLLYVCPFLGLYLRLCWFPFVQAFLGSFLPSCRPAMFGGGF